MIRPFLTGAVGYPMLEILWRRRTHPSMALAGGLSMMLLHRLSKKDKPGMLLKSMMGGAGITAIEYAVGLIWNRKHQVWDYRRMPMNIKGQVCLPFSLVWCGLSGVVLMVSRKNIKGRK